MKKRLFCLVSLLAVIGLFIPGRTAAQGYLFNLSSETLDAYWNEDGTLTLSYVFLFENDPFGVPIEYVDVGLPNSYFDEDQITAAVDGEPVALISEAEYQGDGEGVAIGLGSRSIPPGESGVVEVTIPNIERVLRPDREDPDYASAVVSPTWFASDSVRGSTELTVVFHLPPGVEPEEPRWHESPSGWMAEPETGFDDQGRIVYAWTNAQAEADEQYLFGASFPKRYVPESAVIQESFFEMLGIGAGELLGCLFFCGFGVFFLAIIVISVRANQRRKLKYLPPKISIEGHGIKRGLTAVEAAILLEQPLDKVLTMILFSVIKKEAATVTTRDPLQLEITRPLPEDLHPYEVQFLEAFSETKPAQKRKALQDLMIDLVNSVAGKMKGFSRKETVAYYEDIMQRAWNQVEAADTPEVKSERFQESMEWTMLDENYEGRTRDVFRTGPVFVPVWWPRYDPTYRPSTLPTSAPSAPGGGISLPHLPGSDFAASIVNGVQDFSGDVIGNITEFTSNVTNKTNPVPVSTSRSGRSGGGRSGGGCACACACACAGCACACAGGGR